MEVHPHLLQRQAHVAIAPWRLRSRNHDRGCPPGTPSNPQSFCIQTNLAAVVQPHQDLRPLQAHERRQSIKTQSPPPLTLTLALTTLLQRLEVGFNFGSSSFQERRQDEAVSEVGHLFVDRESGTIRGQFKQDLIWFTEV
jgi:hypothetical protein